MLPRIYAEFNRLPGTHGKRYGIYRKFKFEFCKHKRADKNPLSPDAADAAAESCTRNTKPAHRKSRKSPASFLSQLAPVVHLSNGEKNILVDVPYGSGRIVFVTDPYIVSNAGINRDPTMLSLGSISSLRLAVSSRLTNIIRATALITISLFQFFAGTPVVPIFLQTVS